MNITEKIEDAEEKLGLFADTGHNEGFLQTDEIELLDEVRKVLIESKEEIQKAYNMGE